MSINFTLPSSIQNFSTLPTLISRTNIHPRLEDVNVNLQEIAESDRADLQELLKKFTELKQNNGFGNLFLNCFRKLFQFQSQSQSQYSAERLARKQEIANWLQQYAELIREAAQLGKSTTELTERIRADCNKEALSSSANNQDTAIGSQSQEELVWVKQDLTAIDTLADGFNKTDRALRDFKSEMIDWVSQALRGSQNSQILDYFNNALENLKQKLINGKDQLKNEKANLEKKQIAQIKEEIKAIQEEFDSLKLLPLVVKDGNFNLPISISISTHQGEEKILQVKETVLTLRGLKDKLSAAFQGYLLIDFSTNALISSTLKKEIPSLQKQLDAAENAQLQALERLQLRAIQAQGDEKGLIENLEAFQRLKFLTIKEKDNQLYVLNAEGGQEAIDEKVLQTASETIKTLHHLKKSLLKGYFSKISKNPAGDIIGYPKKNIYISDELRKKITYLYKNLDKVKEGVTCIHGLLTEKLNLSNDLISFATSAVYQKVIQGRIEDVQEKMIDAQCNVNLTIAKIKYFSSL